MDQITVAQCGEHRVVATLLGELPTPGRDVLTPLTDDCAIVRGSKRRQLLKTDCVIEGIHFRPETLPEQIGWKALCRPLSDIAAMGGKPQHALITIAMSPATALVRARGIYAGIGDAAREFGVDVVGGETARSPGPLFISVCVTGRAPKRRKSALRSGARAGDLLFVTGTLGGSFARGHHLDFHPRLKEGRWLVKHFAIRAMMDLSDGLAADLPRLARASGVGFLIDEAALPCAENCTAAQAMNDGEDYELLFAVCPKLADELHGRWRRRFPLVALTQIGALTEGPSPELPGGFDHFR